MEPPIEYLIRNNLQHTNVLVLEITLLLLLTDHLSLLEFRIFPKVFRGQIDCGFLISKINPILEELVKILV